MFASSRNYNPSSFAQVLRQRRPRQRRPGSAGPCSKSIPEPSTIAPSVAPVTAPLAESTPDQLLTRTAASTEYGSSEAELPTMEASAAESTAGNPPSPPNRPPVLNNHRSQLWTTRSLRLVHPAIPPKRRASHGAETSASGSASRTAHNPTKRAKTSEPGAEGARISTDVASAFIYDLTGPKGYSCGLCSKVLNEQARQQCQRCPDVHFCLRCSINSAVLHPGHLFEMVEPLSITTGVPHQQGHDNQKTLSPSSYGGHNSTQTWPHQAQARLSEEGIVEADEKEDEDTSGQDLGGADDEETRQMLRTVIRIPLCKACGTRLFDLRYECQDCPDTNFCSACRSLHGGHTLKVVTSPVIASNSGEGGADADADDASIHNGVDDHGDDYVSPSSGSDSERQKKEDSGEQVDTESDDHGSGDVDERAGSGIENIPSSKECRRIKSGSKSQKSPATQPDVDYQNLYRIAKIMAKAMKRMQTVVHAAEHIMRRSTVQNVSPRRIPGTHDRKRIKLKKPTARREPSPSKALLDFPIDFATLDRDGDRDDDEEVEEENRDGDEDEGDDSGGSGGSDSGSNGSGSSSDGSSGSRNPRRRKRSGHRHRQWSSRERRRLAQLKQKGWKDGQIGAELGRTASAVAQQWRKQKLSIR